MAMSKEVCELCGILVRRLPREEVLLCLIDGTVYYERKEFEEDMGLVFVTLLELSSDSEHGTHVALKVLIANPTNTVGCSTAVPDELKQTKKTQAKPKMLASREKLGRELSE